MCAVSLTVFPRKSLRWCCQLGCLLFFFFFPWWKARFDSILAYVRHLWAYKDAFLCCLVVLVLVLHNKYHGSIVLVLVSVILSYPTFNLIIFKCVTVGQYSKHIAYSISWVRVVEVFEIWSTRQSIGISLGLRQWQVTDDRQSCISEQISETLFLQGITASPSCFVFSGNRWLMILRRLIQIIQYLMVDKIIIIHELLCTAI